MQTAKYNEMLAAPLYKESLNLLYPQVHIVNNPIPNIPTLSEPLGNDPNVVYPLGKVPPNFNASTHGNPPITSSTFFNDSFHENAPNISNNGKAPNNNGNFPIRPL